MLGLWVKIKDKSLDFLNKKAIVDLWGLIGVVEGQENLKIDQKMLETVISARKIKKEKRKFVFF